MNLLTEWAMEMKPLCENYRNANIIPLGHVNKRGRDILAFIHFCWVPDVIESNLETIKIIYDCPFSEETWTMTWYNMKEIWLRVYARTLKTNATDAWSTSCSPSGGFEISFSSYKNRHHTEKNKDTKKEKEKKLWSS